MRLCLGILVSFGIKSMPWYLWYPLVSRVCLGILGILWYAWYPLVSTNLYLLNLVSLVFFGIKSMHWYPWYPLVSRVCAVFFKIYRFICWGGGGAANLSITVGSAHEAGSICVRLDLNV